MSESESVKTPVYLKDDKYYDSCKHNNVVEYNEQIHTVGTCPAPAPAPPAPESTGGRRRKSKKSKKAKKTKKSKKSKKTKKSRKH